MKIHVHRLEPGDTVVGKGRVAHVALAPPTPAEFRRVNAQPGIRVTFEGGDITTWSYLAWVEVERT